MSMDYRRKTRPELRELAGQGDEAAKAELDRRRERVAAVREIKSAVGAAQTAHALRERDAVTLERMMELLVDLKTAVASLEAKIEKMIGGDDQEH
jgi:hypothetical protein